MASQASSVSGAGNGPASSQTPLKGTSGADGAHASSQDSASNAVSSDNVRSESKTVSTHPPQQTANAQIDFRAQESPDISHALPTEASPSPPSPPQLDTSITSDHPGSPQLSENLNGHLVGERPITGPTTLSTQSSPALRLKTVYDPQTRMVSVTGTSSDGKSNPFRIDMQQREGQTSPVISVKGAEGYIGRGGVWTRATDASTLHTLAPGEGANFSTVNSSNPSVSAHIDAYKMDPTLQGDQSSSGVEIEDGSFPLGTDRLNLINPSLSLDGHGLNVDTTQIGRSVLGTRTPLTLGNAAIPGPQPSPLGGWGSWLEGLARVWPF